MRGARLRRRGALRAGKARNPAARRYDRTSLYLALPRAGALEAEPTSVLVETAIVGHLGTPQLAALAIAATRLSTGLTLFNLLTYGTTPQVARLHGAGELFTVALLLAPPAVALIEGAVR